MQILVNDISSELSVRMNQIMTAAGHEVAFVAHWIDKSQAQVDIENAALDEAVAQFEHEEDVRRGLALKK